MSLRKGKDIAGMLTNSPKTMEWTLNKSMSTLTGQVTARMPLPVKRLEPIQRYIAAVSSPISEGIEPKR
jgi:hypothetical protein